MKKRQILIILALLSAVLVLAACGGLDETIWTPDPVEEPEFDEDVTIGLIPGTYEGVGEGGFGGDIHVEVTIDESGRISYIEVTQDSETSSFLTMALSQVSGNIIGTQTTDVATVSGATQSSQAIINAVEDALADVAGVDLETLRSGAE